MKIIHIKSIREERHFMRGTILDYWRWNPVGATTLSRLVLQQTKENGLSWDRATNSPAIFQDSDLPLHSTFCMLHAHFTSHRLQMCFYFLIFCFKLRSKRCMQHLLTVLFFSQRRKQYAKSHEILNVIAVNKSYWKCSKRNFFNIVGNFHHHNSAYWKSFNSL